MNISTNDDAAIRQIIEDLKPFFQQAVQCWNQFSGTSPGTTVIHDILTNPLADAQGRFLNFVNTNPCLSAMLSSSQLGELPVQSFSIGVNAQANLMIGLTGTAGCAVGVGDGVGAEASIFVSIGPDLGVDVAATTGVQFGFWRDKPSDIGGLAVSVEASIEDGVGGTIAIYADSSNLISGVTLSLGIGIEDGVAIAGSYTYVIGSGEYTLRPVYQVPKVNLILITELVCLNPSEVGKDEIYFTFQADGGTTYYYPTYDYYSMGEGDSWACGRSIMIDESVTITLYDADDGSSDDNLGSMTLYIEDLHPDGEVSTFDIVSDGLNSSSYQVSICFLGSPHGK